jgi:hypothetical protein
LDFEGVEKMKTKTQKEQIHALMIGREIVTEQLHARQLQLKSSNWFMNCWNSTNIRIEELTRCQGTFDSELQKLDVWLNPSQS